MIDHGLPGPTTEPLVYPDDKAAIAMVVGPGNGDVIIATPLIACVATQRPDHVLDVYTPCGIDLLRHNPHIRRTIEFTTPTGTRANWQFMVPFLARLTAYGYYKQVIGPSMYYAVSTRFVCQKPRAHISYLGFDVPEDKRTLLYHTPTELEAATQFMAKHHGRPKFLVERYCYSDQSAFNQKWFDALVAYLYRQYPDCTIFVPLGKTERLPTKKGLVGLQDFTLRQMPLIFNSCDAFFSINSGVANACSCTAAKSNIIWIETSVHVYFSSGVYGVEGKTMHYGHDLDSYLAMVHQRLQQEQIRLNNVSTLAATSIAQSHAMI